MIQQAIAGLLGGVVVGLIGAAAVGLPFSGFSRSLTELMYAVGFWGSWALCVMLAVASRTLADAARRIVAVGGVLTLSIPVVSLLMGILGTD